MSILSIKVVDHVLVTKKGGKIVTRDRIEVYEGDESEMHRRVGNRINKIYPVAVGQEPDKATRSNNQVMRDDWRERLQSFLDAIKYGKPITHSCVAEGRRRFTYTLSKLEPDAAETPKEPRTHSGLGKDGLPATPEQREDALKRLAETRIKLGLNPDGTLPKEDDEPPFSVVPQPEEKPVEATEGKKFKLATLSKLQQRMVEKYNLDLDNLPKDKPKGLNKKVWKKFLQIAGNA